MSDFQCDAQTLEAVIDVLAGVATATGIATTVTVPAVAIAKIAARLSDAGVEIPSNEDLTALQDRIRAQGELPGKDA